jgi:hypothetical protein
VERAERSGGLHKRSAEDWGVACEREGIPPLRGFAVACFALWGRRCGQEQARWDGRRKTAKLAKRGKGLLPHKSAHREFRRAFRYLIQGIE